MKLTSSSRRGPYRGWLAGLLCVSLVALASGCSGMPADELSAEESDAFNERVETMNGAWERFRTRGNECSRGPALATCLSHAIRTSGVRPAAQNLRQYTGRMEGLVESGDCRTVLHLLAAKLGGFVQSLERLDGFATEPHPDTVDIAAGAREVRATWDSAVETELKADRAC